MTRTNLATDQKFNDDQFLELCSSKSNNNEFALFFSYDFAHELLTILGNQILNHKRSQDHYPVWTSKQQLAVEAAVKEQFKWMFKDYVGILYFRPAFMLGFHPHVSNAILRSVSH